MGTNKRIEVDMTLLLTFIPVALRLDNCITWPWLAVLSPIILANVIKLVMIIAIMICKKRG